MRILFLINVAIFLFVSNGFCQLKAKLADKHYENLAYYEAAPIYNELADKFLAKNKGEKMYVLRAAISNGKLRKYKLSNEYYASILKLDMNALSETQYMNYIDQLRMLKKYEASVEQARIAHQLFPKNEFFSALINGDDKFERVKKMNKIADAEVAPFNSNKGDFSPVFFEKGLLFVTKSSNKGFLTGKYAWDNGNFTNIMYTEFEAEEWIKPKTLSGEFFSRKHDGPIAFDSSYNKMLITRNLSSSEKKEGVRYLSLYMSEKDKDNKWKTPELLSFSTKEANTGHGCFSPDGKRIYFVSDRESSKGKTDIYYSDLKDGVWQSPVNFEKVNTEGDEMFPYISPNNRLYFASNGRVGLGGLDIYYIDLNDENSEPINVGDGINSPADDFGLIVDETKNKGYFSSNRNGFIDRIYNWKSTPPEIDVIVNVYTNYKPKEAVENHPVWIISSNLKDTIESKTDENGWVMASLDFAKEYKIVVEKEFFEQDEQIVFDTYKFYEDTTLNYDVFLNPTSISARINVVRASDQMPIENAMINMYNPKTKEDTVFYTDENGFVIGNVDRHSEYWVSGSKKGFIDNETNFFTNNYSDRLVELELELEEIKKGTVFKLENIFYDLNKASLREESKVALDKLARFILDNDVKIELSAHTDSRGSNRYNLDLSQQRAQSCVDYLLSKGINKSNIIAKGYGETRLVNRCKNGVKCSEDEHQENRRTEVKILDLNN
ncbi:hypothetical protein CW751_06850 [Brumimicrobium salinarum]|uniref:OmpA-like domain-containing protein n=1 Tax=Brumimicrobium salinarum TaxID=2058658 RepID=A0A2I0R2S1_9FLAO|nr:OmpA family protein [Brumimicrobium salinarum]PKR80882.1 hypothetical protein CW751_06850 [Brumimicrobium salinarum]